MSTKSLIGETAYLASTGTFFGIALLTAALRTFIRVHYVRKNSADDCLFFFAVATLIAGSSVFFAYIKTQYLFNAIAQGRALPPPDFLQEVANAATYASVAEVLCWATIFAVKFSFLLYFRTLVRRLPRVELWWWTTLVVLVPVAAISTSGTFIVCSHAGSSIIANCVAGPDFVQREHAFLYYSVVSDIVTDAMLISIPTIVLRKASFKTSQKLSIALVLCLSLFMVAIGFIRGISAKVYGTEDQAWNSFWVQLEAAISVIAVCPTAFRSYFLINHSSKNSPKENSPKENSPKENNNRQPRSSLTRLWKRTKPSLPSIHVGATMHGMTTMIRENGRTQLESRSDDEYPLSPCVGRGGSLEEGAYMGAKVAAEVQHHESGSHV